MPLQNRVDPFGELITSPGRGLFMGNRGGRLHNDDSTLATRRWVSRAWICCRLAFHDRHRDVWAKGYTELFFLDEVTALSAGHRPCFECRRSDARAFTACWQRAFALAEPPRAAAIDRMLHAERLAGRAKRRHRCQLDELPDGAVVAMEDGAFAVCGASLLHWTPAGYDGARSRSHATTVDVLTPPGILAVLATGYRPLWHPTAIGR